MGGRGWKREGEATERKRGKAGLPLKRLLALDSIDNSVMSTDE